MIQKTVCVIGMHRSGTSALARCINLLGVSLGRGEGVPEFASDNPRGFWENLQLTNLNEDVLKVFNGCWLAPPYLIGNWWQDQRLASLRARARQLLSDTFSNAQFCWKDPRNSLTLPFWIEQFSDRPIIVFIRRNPLEIAKSLEQRNGLTKSAALAMWSVYTYSAIVNIASFPVLTVDFGDLLTDSPSCLARIKAFLENCGLSGLEVPASAVDEFLTTDLLHWQRREEDFFDDVEVSPDHKRLFEVLRDLPEQTDEFRIPALPERFFLHHNTLVLHRDQTPSPQTELEEARTAQAGLQAQIAALQAQIAALQGQIAGFKAVENTKDDTIRAQQTKIDDLVRQSSALRSERDAAVQAKKKHAAANRAQQNKIKDLGKKCGALGNDRAAARARVERYCAVAKGHTVTIADLSRKLRRMQQERDALVRNEACLQKELTQIKERGHGPLRWSRDLGWSCLRTAYRAAPVGDRFRGRFKDLFYSAFGRVFPKSLRYKQYLEWQEILQRNAQLSLLPTASFPRSASMGPRPYDVFVFPVIDWHFRHQRPQHIALALAAKGHRVFYFKTTFVGDSSTYEPEPDFVATNVCIISLPCSGRPPVIYEDALEEEQLNTIEFGLEELRNKFNVAATVSIVDHPFWHPVVERLNNNRIMYDCLDHHAGFSTNNPAILKLEDLLLRGADLTVTTSMTLTEGISKKTDRNILIRNGTEYDHFAEPPAELALTNTRPIIGYYGAISEWFDTELVVAAARALPHCNFVLVGSTFGADVSALQAIPNVHLTGEVSYKELPRYLHAFDVCTIPFKITELTLCTNPVKVYEYLSAGKPVVAVDLPELAEMGEVVRTAASHDDFIAHLREALDNTSPEQVERRRAFARENTWEKRGEVLGEALGSLFPRVSIVVLTYNQLQFTKACLDSLEKFTDYPDWELIIVDNASTDKTPPFLKDFAKDRSHVRLILNDDNRGFAAGNNQGARAASGEYIVFLNNDTYVTRGWLADLLAHFRRDPHLGLLNPITNNIGNEAKIDISYDGMSEMAVAARGYTETHRGERLALRAAAFFCVMIPKQVWNEVGPLDEEYGVGFFEDDDYAMRALQSDYTLACAEDVFIHHHLSASFDEIPSPRRQELFEKNKAYFESKWGPWEPHKYRETQKST